MPESPAGRQWHKPEALMQKDWEEGWRALLMGESDGCGVYFLSPIQGEGWEECTVTQVVVKEFLPRKTKRPLPVEPVKPEPKWGPLEKKDVSRSSTFRQTPFGKEEYTVAYLHENGVMLNSIGWTTFEVLQRDNWQFSKIDGSEWQPCRKEVQE
jgi:hypothetical protein